MSVAHHHTPRSSTELTSLQASKIHEAVRPASQYLSKLDTYIDQLGWSEDDELRVLVAAANDSLRQLTKAAFTRIFPERSNARRRLEKSRRWSVPRRDS